MPAKFSLEHRRCPCSSQCSPEKNQGAWRLARCQQRAQAQTYPWVGGFLVLCENQGVGRGGFVTLIRVLCQKAVQSQIIFPVA